MSLVKGSLQEELDAFFQIFNGSEFEEQVVTKSAFCQARKQLLPSAFKALSDHFIRRYYQKAEINHWHGFRLCAVDGSFLRLPDTDELRDYFGCHRSAKSLSTQALMSSCYDVLNGMTLDLQIAPGKSSERDLAVEHLKQSGATDLLIYDRGYPALWFMALHRDYERAFCMRTSSFFLSPISAFAKSRHQDKIITIELEDSREAKPKCEEWEIQCKPLTVRLIKVRLSSGEDEILITSLLDKKAFPHRVFKDLYHKRWGIEEDYKRQKYPLEIENFTGLTVHAIKQDIYAKLFIKNVTMAVVGLSQSQVKSMHSERKHKYKINISQAVSRMKHIVVKYFKARQPVKLLASLIDLLAKNTEPVRENRRFERVKRAPKSRRHYTNYKRTR